MAGCPPAEQDIQLLVEAGMWELYLIDRADGPTDQARQLLTDSGKLESILRALAPSSVTVLPITLIPLLHYRENLAALPRAKRQGSYILPIALDLGVVGGHYAICYAHDSLVEVFDSMVSAEGPGVYTPAFLAVGQAYFPDYHVHMVQPARGEATLQPTGGFLWIPPTFLASSGDDTDVNRTHRIIQLCNYQAQDHFCWAWCLLYLHSRLAGYELAPTRQWLARTSFPSVALAKVYVWLLMSWLGVKLPDELHSDFLSLWDAEDRMDPEDYRRYLIRMDPEPRHLTSALQCLELVLPPTKILLLRQEGRQIVPPECV
jgi:hypothetical protein